MLTQVQGGAQGQSGEGSVTGGAQGRRRFNKILIISGIGIAVILVGALFILMQQGGLLGSAGNRTTTALSTAITSSTTVLAASVATSISSTSASSKTTSTSTVTTVSSYPVVGCCGDFEWTMSGVPRNGYTSISVDMTPHYNSLSSQQSYFYSLNDWFTGPNNVGAGGYAGLQTNGIMEGQAVGKMLIFSLWGAVGGVSVQGGDTETFNETFMGYSDRVRYNWRAGDMYSVNIYLNRTVTSGPYASNNLWGAYVKDLNNGSVQYIGGLYEPTAYGNFTSGPVTFTEMYTNSPPAPCNLITPTETAFTNMSADGGQYVWLGWAEYTSFSSVCSDYVWNESLPSGYIEAGGIAK